MNRDTLLVSNPNSQSYALDYFRAVSEMDRAHIRTAITDLQSGDVDDGFYEACLYFFMDGGGVDDNDHHTFQGLCNRHRIDANAAARSIWNGLKKGTQESCLTYLRKVARRRRLGAISQTYPSSAQSAAAP